MRPRGHGVGPLVRLRGGKRHRQGAADDQTIGGRISGEWIAERCPTGRSVGIGAASITGCGSNSTAIAGATRCAQSHAQPMPGWQPDGCWVAASYATAGAGAGAGVSWQWLFDADTAAAATDASPTGALPRTSNIVAAARPLRTSDTDSSKRKTMARRDMATSLPPDGFDWRQRLPIPLDRAKSPAARALHTCRLTSRPSANVD